MRHRFSNLAVLITATLISIAGCPGSNTQTGGNTNAGGQVAVEVPEFLPGAISIDVTELPEDPNTLETAAVTRDTFERILRTSSTVVLRFHELADRVLGFGALIRKDMTSPTQTQVQGTFDVGGKTVAYKADLAAFDFNGDGRPEGSGNASELPVTLRVWTDAGGGYQRFLCALVSERPSSANVGAGQLYLHPGAALSEIGDVQLYVDYDRTAPEHGWNLAYFSGLLHPLYDVNIGIARVDQRTNTSGGLEKTVRTSQQLAIDPYEFTTFQSAVHWAVAQPTLLMSVAATKAGVSLTFANLCLDFETRAPTTPGTDPCSGLDTQDMTLLPVPLGGENTFPAAFPEQPTF